MGETAVRMVRWLAAALVICTVFLAATAGWLWSNSHLKVIQSSALDETRQYRVFNPSSDGMLFYSLDGQSMRHSLIPATIFTLRAFLLRKQPPKLVAIHSGNTRDIDFRNENSTPAYWRPAIVGHAYKFDQFLLDELRPELEYGSSATPQVYLLGHSLAGLYALDLASRKPSEFSGVVAFAPTFSHDTSIANRLTRACAHGVFLYANWGLESARDSEVFDDTARHWKSDPACKDVMISSHLGSFHQTIMLSGQIELAARYIE